MYRQSDGGSCSKFNESVFSQKSNGSFFVMHKVGTFKHLVDENYSDFMQKLSEGKDSEQQE